MGITDKILSFGQTPRGKIISWGLVIGFTIIFFLGILLVAIPQSQTPRLQSLGFSASNMPFRETVNAYDDDEPGTRQILNSYHLTVSRPETLVGIIANPISSRANVQFKTDSPFVSLNNSNKANIRAGGTLRIHLTRDTDGQFGFRHFRANDSDYNADMIQIEATSGRLRTLIFVRIVLNPDDYQLTAVLEQSIIGTDVWAPALTQTINGRTFPAISIAQLNPLNNEPTIQYRVRLRFSILDDILHDTADTQRNDWNAFIYTELYDTNLNNNDRLPNTGWAPVIELFNTEDKIFTVAINKQSQPILTANTILEYKIQVYRTQYFTKTNFTITLVP
jgi:hypothetical protein